MGVWMLLSAAPGSASDRELPRPSYTTAPFWQAARNPGARRAATLLRQGRSQLYPALRFNMLLGPDLMTHRRAALENALARFERARMLTPHDPELLFLSAKALSMWERRAPGGGTQRRSSEAIARFESLRSLDPVYEAYDVAFDLGILYTREQQFARASREYRRALDARLTENGSSTVLANLAEVTMMSGDVERAVELYERAIRLSSGEEKLLPRWGLSVALDRLGERNAALDQARRAIRDDRRPMAVLGHNDVFFVPEFEVNYYYALGYLALAEERAGEGRAVTAALVGYRKRLVQAASPESLRTMLRLVAELKDAGHGEPLSALHNLLKQASRGRSSKKRAPARNLDGPLKDVVESLLRSLRAFHMYLDAGGSRGPWGVEAKAHVREIEGWLK